jgi:hypothetical protein
MNSFSLEHIVGTFLVGTIFGVGGIIVAAYAIDRERRRPSRQRTAAHLTRRTR